MEYTQLESDTRHLAIFETQSMQFQVDSQSDCKNTFRALCIFT